VFALAAETLDRLEKEAEIEPRHFAKPVSLRDKLIQAVASPDQKRATSLPSPTALLSNARDPCLL
jgi:hypothetical protein